MRLRATLAATFVTAVLACVAAATALGQPRIGIVRPANEQGLTQLQLGTELYAGNCASCHGIAGAGVVQPTPRAGSGNITGQGPSLRGVGALAANFYLRRGIMPLRNPYEQPLAGRVLFTDREIRALVAYVNSLGGGPPTPTPHPERGSYSEGLQLFTEHCAGCHQAVAQGGVVTGARVPPLQKIPATEIAAAVRIGPYLMPRFTTRDLSDAQLNSLIRYVLLTNEPPNQGGWGIGNIGPFPEGLVTWFIAIGALVITCMVIGTRLRRRS
jgi:ubiquinol-cytochrome c reductase cytochrome c subunit